jgi:hypothetical protein
MFVSCDCRVLSGRSLCDGLIPHPERERDRQTDVKNKVMQLRLVKNTP